MWIKHGVDLGACPTGAALRITRYAAVARLSTVAIEAAGSSSEVSVPAGLVPDCHVLGGALLAATRYGASGLRRDVDLVIAGREVRAAMAEIGCVPALT